MRGRGVRACPARSARPVLVENARVSDGDGLLEPRLVKRTVLAVAGLNFGYFWVEVVVALAIGSVALFADSVDFLEDTAVNLLIFFALGLFILVHRTRSAVKEIASLL